MILNKAGATILGTGSTTTTVVFPVAPTVGSLLVLIMGGPITQVESSGTWNSILYPLGAGGLRLWTKTATSGDTGVSVNHNGDGFYPVSWAYFELPAGTTQFGSGMEFTSSYVGTAGGTIVGLPGTGQLVLATFLGNVTSNGTHSTTTWNAPYTTDATGFVAALSGSPVQKDGCYFTVGHVDDFMSTSSTPTFVTDASQVSGSGQNEALMLAFTTPAGGGTTPVSTTRSMSWDVAANPPSTPVSTNRSTLWDMGAKVSTPRPATWAVSTSVTSTRATTWAALAQASTTRPATWGVYTGVATGRSSSWVVLSSVALSRVATWDVLASLGVVSISRSGSWDMAAMVAANRPTSWSVSTSLSTTKAASWDTGMSISANRPTSWSTAAATSINRPSSWDVSAKVSIDKPASWTVLTPVLLTRPTTWEVNMALAALRTANWDVKKQIDKDLGATWNMLADVAASRTLEWDVLKNLLIERTPTWDSLSMVKVSTTTFWAIESQFIYIPVRRPVLRINIPTSNLMLDIPNSRLELLP